MWTTFIYIKIGTRGGLTDTIANIEFPQRAMCFSSNWGTTKIWRKTLQVKLFVVYSSVKSLLECQNLYLSLQSVS
jgi:hypothetical protein